MCTVDLLTAGLAATFGKNRPEDVSRASAFAAGMTAPDGLTLHVRRYGSRVASALPVACLPDLARTAAALLPRC